VLDFMQPQPAEGGRWALVGRHGGIKPAGRLRGRDNMMPGR
jgi:hypothetical protein